jgi:DNA adenine methylase
VNLGGNDCFADFTGNGKRSVPTGKVRTRTSRLAVSYIKINKTKAKFVLSTWYHNDFRENLMIERYWNKFHIYTRDRLYHGDGKVENRREIVEALVCNFEPSNIERYNHKPRQKQSFKIFF